MKYYFLIIFFVILLLHYKAYLVASDQLCPCNCTFFTDNKALINCTNYNLTQIPTTLLNNTVVLDLSYNKITDISILNQLFSNLQDLTHLNISNNLIENFTSIPNSPIAIDLVDLNLSFNQLKRVESAAVAKYYNLVNYSLAGNYNLTLDATNFQYLFQFNALLNNEFNLDLSYLNLTNNFLNQNFLLCKSIKIQDILKKLKNFYLSNNLLIELPLNAINASKDEIFSNLIRLDLSSNSLSNDVSINFNSNMKSIYLTQLNYLKLNKNSIKSISINKPSINNHLKLLKSSSFLIELDLSENKLSSFDFLINSGKYFNNLTTLNISLNSLDINDKHFQSFLNDFHINFKFIKKFDFFQDPSNIYCFNSCSIISIKKWLLENRNLSNDINLYKCHINSTNFKYIIDLNETSDEWFKTNCSNTSHKLTITIAIVISVLAIIFLLIFSVALSKQREKKRNIQKLKLLNDDFSFESEFNQFVNEIDGNEINGNQSSFRSLNTVKLKFFHFKLWLIIKLNNIFTLKFKSKLNNATKYDEDDDADDVDDDVVYEVNNLKGVNDEKRGINTKYGKNYDVIESA